MRAPLPGIHSQPRPALPLRQNPPLYSLRMILSGLVFLSMLGPNPGQSESTLRLFAPAGTQDIGATTFNQAGQAIGHSRLDIKTQPGGLRHLHVTMAIDEGGSNTSEAIFAPIVESGTTSGSNTALRLIEERSRAIGADGHKFPLLVIDHEKGRVSCYPDGQVSPQGKHLSIEGDDRVANVPMQLLFLPLVRGKADALRFQIATCADGPVLHDMIAVRGTTLLRGGRQVVQIQYGPDFGRTLAWLASRLLPSFSFWFDANDATYLGHRMQLYREGPEITLVRAGLTPPDLGLGSAPPAGLGVDSLGGE